MKAMKPSENDKLTYEQAVAKKERLEKLAKEKGDAVSELTVGVKRSPLGLLPDRLKESKEWIEARAEQAKAWAMLRNYNAWFCKKYPRSPDYSRKN